MENIKQELAKNKEMKESIKKFRDEAKKLEESDALREARRKYVSSGMFPELFLLSVEIPTLNWRSSAWLEALSAKWMPQNVYLMECFGVFNLFFF